MGGATDVLRHSCLEDLASMGNRKCEMGCYYYMMVVMEDGCYIME